MKKILFVLFLIIPFSIYSKKLVNTIVEDPEKGSPEWVIKETLRLGMEDNMDEFYNTVCDPDYCIDTERGRKEMAKYTWKRFKKFADSYVLDKKKISFKVIYTRPEEFDENTEFIKFFLYSSKRDNPTPILIRKCKDGKYRVYNLSL